MLTNDANTGKEREKETGYVSNLAESQKILLENR